jgi:hypothetical protein
MNKKQLIEYTDRVVAIVELSLRGVYNNDRTTTKLVALMNEQLSRPLWRRLLDCFR